MCVKHITSHTETKAKKAKESILAASRGEKVTLVENIDLGEFKQVLYVKLKEAGKDKVLNSINKLKKRDEVFYVGPNYYLESHSDNSNQTYENYFENHWAYDLINLEDALDELTNNMPNILVGVIDSGIDGTHPDLVNYIDEDLSADFAHDDDDDPLVDDHGHGTMVAGIIRGVCNKVKLVSLKAQYDTSDSGNAQYLSSNVCEAIEYAGSKGIKILNMSNGWVGSTANGQFDNTDYDMVMNMFIAQYPGIIICSAGNDNDDYDDGDLQFEAYPQQLTNNNLLVVASSKINNNNEEEIADSSNVGAITVDIFAPGDDIPTTIRGGTRGEMSGTSAAAPIVTGVAAIMLAYSPGLSTHELKEFIIESADLKNVFNNNCVSGGRINAYEALYMVISVPCAHIVYDYLYIDDYYHNKTCHRCGYTIVQSHTWNLQGTMYRCTLCGWGSLSRPPIVVGSLPNEEDILIALLPVNDEEYLT